MPIFEIEANGKTFEVEAPSQEAALAALPKDKGPGGFKGVAQGILNETTIGKALKGVYEGAKSAVTLPGDVMAGRVDPMSDEGIRRSYDIAALGTPINPAIRAGDKIIPGMARNLEPKVPTAPELKTISGQQYNAARGMDVTYAAPAVKNWADTTKANLGNLIPERAPETHALLDRLTTPGAAKYSTYDQLQTARDGFQGIARDYQAKGADREAARRVRDALDGFIEGTHAPGAVAGPAAEAAALTTAGRGNRAAAERANDITGALDRARTGILERAQGRTAAANSGRNFDNAARSRLESVLEKPKEVQGWSDAEIAQAAAIVDGNRIKNFARTWGNRLGGGGGIFPTGIGAGVGSAIGGSVGAPVAGAVIGAAVPPTIGAAFKGAANRMTRKELEALDEALRKRSPKFMENPDLTPVSARQRAMLLRALLTGATNTDLPNN